MLWPSNSAIDAGHTASIGASRLGFKTLSGCPSAHQMSQKSYELPKPRSMELAPPAFTKRGHRSHDGFCYSLAQCIPRGSFELIAGGKQDSRFRLNRSSGPIVAIPARIDLRPSDTVPRAIANLKNLYAASRTGFLGADFPRCSRLARKMFRRSK